MRKIYLLFAVLFIVGKTWGQYSLTSSPYTQDFNTLANSGTTNTFMPDGWLFSESGTSANTEYAAGTGSSATGNTYSFGASASSERALGELTSGTLSTAFGFYFTNNTASIIASLEISYTGEQWRLGAVGREDRLDFQYSVDATSLTTGTWTDVNALDFVAPINSGSTGALDGNLSANRVTINSTILSLNIPVGSTFFIRWNAFNASDNDDGIGIDDLILTIPPQIPTPVELISFAGQKEETKNILRWTTASENNNHGFEVQYSKDGINYSVLGFVSSLAQSGFSSSQLHYSFADINPAGTKHYYRLRQMDYDGHSKFSSIVMIRGNKRLTLAIGGIFPNPASGSLVNVIIDAPKQDKVTLIVTDLSGRILKQKAANVQIGSNTIPIDIGSIGQGSYFVKLACSENCESTVIKFIRQ